ncbi:hypothetical protein EDD29_4442 [Actinocorallia herbida]|uniref:Neocarzinostatin family protein n=1 Tax=Actinocorallia herbida TaxID=58109 RepID=A0A3N1D007_9ACTN|nr:hypothetical protein [Actinocorallia herbida]ROO86860.1 hypothetical protein EDD29_4442 [Actinocorallia herbida]
MRRIAAAATVAGAGALALVLSSPALALSWSVTGGGSVTAVNSGNINFQDVTAGITAACTSGSGTGSVPNGSNTPVGTLSSLSLSSCTGAGISFTLTVNVASSAINVTGPTVSGVTPGSITGITVNASALGGLCKLTAGGGSLNGSYTNATGALTTTGATGVTVTSVTAGCLGLVKKNDVANLTGTFIVSNGSGGHPQITAV